MAISISPTRARPGCTTRPAASIATTPAGKLTQLVNTVPSPNGLVMNKSENVLYVGVTRGNAVWRLPLMGDGMASKVGLFIQMSGGHGGPDGMALDEEGGLVVAHPSTTAWRFDSLGRPTHHVDCGDDIFCTNIAFSGADLYVVVSRPSPKIAGGTILKATMPVAGKAMFSHASGFPLPILMETRQRRTRRRGHTVSDRDLRPFERRPYDGDTSPSEWGGEILARALADVGDGLDLDQDLGRASARHLDQRRGREVALEELARAPPRPWCCS